MQVQSAVLGAAEDLDGNKETERNSNDQAWRYWNLTESDPGRILLFDRDLTLHSLNVSISCRGKPKSRATAAIGTCGD